tara:strand:- start:1879 stop:2103 length:225 start_codon:yes stop_codon:yes gene_type:complete
MVYKMKATLFVKKSKDDIALRKIRKGNTIHYLGKFWGTRQIDNTLHQKTIEVDEESWPAWVASLGYTIEEENIV